MRPRRAGGQPQRGRENAAVAPSEAVVARPAPRGHPPARQSGARDQGFVVATARLSLETARRVRFLTAVCARTIASPDSSSCGLTIKGLAEEARTDHVHEAARLWARLILAVLALPTSGTLEAALVVLCQHAAQSVSVAPLQEHLLDCVVVCRYAGDSSNLRLAVTADLYQPMQALTRVLIQTGATVRFGPAPRSGQERAVANALSGQ